MARAKYQVLVIPYCINDNQAQFCLFQRSDMGIWQFIAGGGDDEDGSIIESAKREAFEEAGISETYNFFKLDTCCSNFIRLLALIVVCFHWFNPFAWLMLKLLYSDIELVTNQYYQNATKLNVRNTHIRYSPRQKKQTYLLRPLADLKSE